MRRDVSALGDGVWDLVIVGGGITGAGVALDAALRGLRVALVDKGDFAGGTSSASSKLIHGGLRYLEHGEFRLVREALVERGRLLANAPHLVRPLRFLLPFAAGARIPGWKWRLGLGVYDILAGSHNIRRSRPVHVSRLRRELPGLRGDLYGGAEFYDAQCDDARLCIEVLRTAAAHGARPANYVEATGFEISGGRITALRARDRLGGGEWRLAARLVLNAAGPWGDAVRRLAGEETGPLLRPTEGVHLLAPPRGLPAALLLLHPRDGRVFFVIPWLGKTLLGTTDTDCPNDPDHLTVTDADADYLLEGYNSWLAPPLTRAELLGSFVGLRPLLASQPGAPSDRSREFAVTAGPTGLLTVAGGKYTTFRAMAETIVDRVCERLGVRRRCRTRRFRLDGAPRAPWPLFRPAEIARLRRRHGLTEPEAAHLVDRYGTRAADVAAYLDADPGLRKPVVAGEPELLAEFAFQRDHEMAVLPADCWLRRTRLGLYCGEPGASATGGNCSGR